VKALVLKEYNRFSYEDVPVPDVGPDEVLVRVRACGICGSDVHGMDGSTGRRRPPIIMGHEAAGVIERVGERVMGRTGSGGEGAGRAGAAAWKAGDRVTFDSTVYCGECFFCRRGEVNLCDARRVLGVSCEDYRRHGAFAELVAVPERILYRLPEGLSFERAALVEPLSIALHAVNRTRLSIDDSAVVVGTGMVGLLVLQALRIAGAGLVIAVDLEPRRLELARKLGADVTLDARSAGVAEEVRRLTDGRGADAALEVVGVTRSVETAVACLRKGGQLTIVGNLSPVVELPLQAVVTRELTLNGSCASRGEYPACLDLMARGKIDVDPLISASAPLEEGPSWFERLHAGAEGLLKVVLVP
jgi:L-iditol 2-dehydrogenase